jgi:transcriptional regulator with XRE-family HTH domain
MDLKTYLEKTGLTYAELAERLGIHAQSIKNIACGIRRPGLRLALKIEELTEGKVTPKEMISPTEKKLKTGPQEKLK